MRNFIDLSFYQTKLNNHIKQYQTKKGEIPIIQFYRNYGKNSIVNPEATDSKLCVLMLPNGTIVHQWVRASNIVEVKDKRAA